MCTGDAFSVPFILSCFSKPSYFLKRRLISTNNAVDLSLRLAGSQFLGTDPSDSIIVNTNNIDAMNKERVKFPAR